MTTITREEARDLLCRELPAATADIPEGDPWEAVRVRFSDRIGYGLSPARFDDAADAAWTLHQFTEYGVSPDDDEPRPWGYPTRLQRRNWLESELWVALTKLLAGLPAEWTAPLAVAS